MFRDQDVSPDYNFRDFILVGTVHSFQNGKSVEDACAFCYLDEMGRYMAEWILTPKDLTNKLERGKITEVTSLHKEGR